MSVWLTVHSQIRNGKQVPVMSEQPHTQPERRVFHPATYQDWIRAGFFSALGVAALALVALVVWRLARAALEIIAPFVVAAVLAMLLDPLVDRLERRGLRRIFAVGLVFCVFLLLLLVAGAIAIPILVSQASELAQSGPEYIARLRAYTDDFLAHHRRILGFSMPRNFDMLSAEFSDRASEILKHSAGSIPAFLLGSVAMLLETVVTLIVTFYLLLDIDRLRARLYYLLPEKARGPMRMFAQDIGRVFSEYLRGLLIVSVLYGAMTLVLLLGLSLVHSELARYALLIGVVGGLLYAVPYIGPLVTALITFLVAFAAGGIGFGGVAVVLTLALNQVFDNIVTPRIVGGGVGLHPVAALFALTLGGALFGLWGMLLSVPIAASIQAILFRLFPKLTTPTPLSFLQAQGVRPDEEEAPKILQGGEVSEESRPAPL